jgi:hypothetical protein
VCWTLVYIAAESVIRTGAQQVTLFPLMPVWFLLCGAGLSRLLPAITGDIPLPWARYALAALAVISLAGIRLQAEWHEHGPAAVASPQAYSLAAPKPQPRP